MLAAHFNGVLPTPCTHVEVGVCLNIGLVGEEGFNYPNSVITYDLKTKT